MASRVVRTTILVLAAGVASGVLVVSTIPAAATTNAVHPPQTGRIVEGVSAGGVSIGDSYADVVAVWGKPDNVYCTQTTPEKGVGPVYRYGMSGCSWYSAPHETIGTLEAYLAPLTQYGATTHAKVVMIWIQDLKYQPGFRWRPVFTGWKTASGLGLRSTVVAVQRAYGKRLHTLPHPKILPSYGSFPTYVITRRGGKRWVTVFSFSRRRGVGSLQVHDIMIEEYALLAPWIKQAAQIYGPSDVPLQ